MTTRLALASARPTVRHGLAAILAMLPDVSILDVGAAAITALGACDLLIVGESLLTADPEIGLGHLIGLFGPASVLPLIVTSPPRAAAQWVLRSPLGALSIDEDEDVLQRSVIGATRGERHIPAPIAQTLACRMLDPEPARLSHRELDVMRLAASGSRTSVIAADLHMSPHTVRTHLRNVYGKLGVNSRTAAVSKLIATGQLPGQAPV